MERLLGDIEDGVVGDHEVSDLAVRNRLRFMTQ